MGLFFFLPYGCFRQLTDRLTSVAELIPGEVTNALQQVDLPDWDTSRKDTLKQQIVQLTDPDQPVRKLISTLRVWRIQDRLSFWDWVAAADLQLFETAHFYLPSFR